MPTISVTRDRLFERLGRTYTEEEFDELCFDFGIELDEVTSESLLVRKEHGDKDATIGENEEVVYKIEVAANRYDLLCIEGLSYALNVFNGVTPVPPFHAVVPTAPLRLTASPEVLQIRPFVVSAVLRGVKFTKESYNSFIDLQDKLHNNICRRRTLVAIGTHDLDTIQGPFTYEALKPSDIKFVPLNQQKSMDGNELMQFYETDLKLKKFLPIIRDSPVYPVIYDANRVVLSLPPIINGDHSKITLNTKNVFIECTATDMTKANIVLDTVVTMFSQYCEDQFGVEAVEVVQGDGTKELFPQWEAPLKMECDVEYINRAIGINVDADTCVKLLDRMMLPAEKLSEATVRVTVPPTRSDILQACDIMEDVAIAYGINNIESTLPRGMTMGGMQLVNKISDNVRVEMATAGYTEVLTMALCSKEENFQMLRKVDDGSLAVELANPKTLEFQICRTSLLAGLLKTLNSNKSAALPVKLFELSDVVLKDATSDTGARNHRRLCAVYCNTTSGFELTHGVLDFVMMKLSVKPAATASEGELSYTIRPCDHPTYFPGRQAEVLVRGDVVGVFGIVHPEVLRSFDVPHPVSAMEIDMSVFL